jgi:small subunit ribosomal protein S2
MRELLEAGIHFGHQTHRWHPKMKRYIFGQRNGIYIIDLQLTLRQLYKAYAVVRNAAENGGNILFVGTKNQAREPIQQHAERCGMYHVTNRWLGGTLTNFQTVKKSIQELKSLQEAETSGKIERYSKKEGVMMRKRRAKLEKNLSGIQDMPNLPQVIFVIDAHRENIAVKEAERLGIPCVGITDTNCDPDVVSIPVPGNDDAIRAVNLYCSLIADAVIEGKTRAEKKRADEAAEAKAQGAEAAAEPQGEGEEPGTEASLAAAEAVEEAPAAAGEGEAAEEAVAAESTE